MSIIIVDSGNTIKWTDTVKDKDVVFNKNEVLITLKTDGVDVFEIEDSHYRETFKYTEVTVPTSTDSDDLLDQLQSFAVPPTNSLFPTFKKGVANYEAWYPAGMLINGDISSDNQVGDFLRAIPFIVNETVTLDAIGFLILTASGSAGAIAILAVYDHDPVNVQPNNLIVTAGTLPIDSTGTKIITGIGQSLTPGIYWAVFNHDGNLPAIFTTFTGEQFMNMNGSPAGFNVRSHVRKASVFTDPPPDPFPTVLTGDFELGEKSEAVIIYLRFT